METNILGEGAFSKVYTVMNKYSRRKFALKKIEKQRLSKKDKLFLDNEIKIHCKLYHPNIISFIGY